MAKQQKREHSLRNEYVGQAYMTMLDVYERCRAKGQVTPEEILAEIERHRPWRSGYEWLDEAWAIALSEICDEFQLKPTDVAGPASNSADTSR